MLLIALLSASGCDPNRRINAGNVPVEYNNLACFAFVANANSTLPIHLPLDVHEKLAKTGDAFCQHSLGERYERGLDAPVDYARAREWYSLLPYRDVLFGRMAEQGVGQPVNLQQAKAHYQKAADLGFGTGHYALAKLLEREQDSDANRQAIMSHYLNATEYYDDKAWKEIRRMLSSGVSLDAEQKKQYADLWLKGLWQKIRSRIRFYQRRNRMPDLERATELARVSCTFYSNGNAPDFRIVDSSGDPAADAFVLGLLQEIRMDPVQVQGMGDRFQIQIPVKFGGAAKQQPAN